MHKSKARVTVEQMLCLILPLIFTVSFLLGWLRLKGSHANLYEIEVGISLCVAFTIILFSVVRQDGSRFLADVVITAIHNETGALCGFAKITRDITESRKAANNLRASEERFRLFVDAVQDYALLMLDVRGNVISWNAGAERIKGYQADEIIGRHFSCFYLPEAIANRHPDEELRIAAKEGHSAEEGWLRKDGSRFLADVVITAIHNETGALCGFAKITRDVTERKKVQQQLEKSRVRLEAIHES